MAKQTNKLYTLVEHNGIRGAIMLNAVRSEAQAKKVVEKGGILINDWKTADDLEYKANYAVADGEITSVGCFAPTKIDGALLFVPSSEFKEKFVASVTAEA